MARIRKSVSDEISALKKVIWYIALYIRLSKDDGNDESLSVTNQKKILTEYVEKFFQGDYVIVDYYVDDGRTGTDYDRPDFQRMIHDVEAKKANCVICKNLARAFRNYSDQGYFIESFFPLHGTRFITLGDPKVDTYLNPEAVSGMEVPINGLMNDRFAAQTSNSGEWYQVEHTHEPIVSSELFEIAQELHAKDTRTAPDKKENYLFSGFLKYADCKKAMTRRASKEIVYYNCST